MNITEHFKEILKNNSSKPFNTIDSIENVLSGSNKISIIIPTFNSEKYIVSCLNAIRNCIYPQDKYEIIVVDNGSKDRTINILECENVIILHNNKNNIGSSRNLGANAAKNDILAFVDSDCLVDKCWLVCGVGNILYEDALFGNTYDLPEKASWVESLWFSNSLNKREEVEHNPGGNIFIRKSLFNDVGGFDENLKTGEDAELCARVKKVSKVIRDPRIKVVHLGNPKTIYQFYKREVWYGLGAFGSFKQNWFDKPLIGTLLFGLILFALLLGVILLDKISMLFLLFATVFYRIGKQVANLKKSIGLIALYTAYYSGRLVALFYLLLGKEKYHGIKEENAKSTI